MKNTTTHIRTIALVAAVMSCTLAVAGCSSTKHSGGSGTTLAGGGTGDSTASANGSGSGTITSSGSGNGSAGTNPNGAVSGGSNRTTVPVPTTTPPSADEWLKAHKADLRTLKNAAANVNAAFQANDDTAKKTALVACANAAAPLARTAPGSLPQNQADAFVAISDSCAAMTHDLKSGDTTAVDSGKITFDNALVVVTPLLG